MRGRIIRGVPALLALLVAGGAAALEPGLPTSISVQAVCPEPELERHVASVLQRELGSLPDVVVRDFNQGEWQLYLSLVRVRDGGSDDVLSYAVGWVIGSNDAERAAYHLRSFAVATFPADELDAWLARKVHAIDAEYFEPLRSPPAAASD
jgi:hypothetical protein